jgi:hypothetical protein
MTSYFAGIIDFIGGHPHYALTAIFLLALSEATPVIGTIVPGSRLLLGFVPSRQALKWTHGPYLVLRSREPFSVMVCPSG